jgi:hypothetical protein
MHIRIFMQALWILHVAGERVEAVELTAGGVVPAGSQVLLLGFGVEVFAAVAEARQGGGGRYGCAGGAVDNEQLAVCGDGEAGAADTTDPLGGPNI